MHHAPRAVRATILAATAALVTLLVGCASEPENAEPLGSVGQLLPSTSPDGHQLREVPAQEAPSVGLEVSDDPDSGWNVHLDTERFTFAPERVGGDARPGEGHAHLYLDGDKIARLYGPWYHLPASAVPAGEHTVMVQLNANDHSAWATDGEPVSASAEITATGDEDGHSHDDEAEQPSEPQVTPTPDADVALQIEIADGAVSPPPGRVSVPAGDTVRIEVTSDQPDTVHVHGYDLEAAMTPSRPAVLEFTADQPGLYEVETHDSGLQLTQLVVE